jgi:transcriptional regulator with XRE-family HTH domain
MIVARQNSLPYYAANLRRLMAREGLTIPELIARTGLNHRTLKELLAGRHQPQARTLHRLAHGLNVPIEELFQDPALLRHRLFDRHTNPVVEEVIAAQPQIFHGWTAAEFDELYSRFGTGGALTKEGTFNAVCAMNRRRDLLAKVTLLLETSEAELLESFLELLYRRAVITAPDTSPPEAGFQHPTLEPPPPSQSNQEIM